MSLAEKENWTGTATRTVPRQALEGLSKSNVERDGGRALVDAEGLPVVDRGPLQQSARRRIQAVLDPACRSIST